MKTLLNIILLLTLSFLLYLKFLYTPPFKGQPLYLPPMPSFTGPFTANNLLQHSTQLDFSCEFLTDDDIGNIYCSSPEEGLVRRIHPNLSVELLVQTGGKPLGLIYWNGHVYICDAKRGLLDLYLGYMQLSVLVPGRAEAPQD
jgi:hypothetical protein